MLHLQVLMEADVNIKGLSVISGQVPTRNHEHMNEIVNHEAVEYVAVVYKVGTVHVFTNLEEPSEGGK